MFESNRATKPFTVRGEPERSVTMYNKHTTCLEIMGNKEWMLRTQKWCIDLCIKQLVTFQAESLDSCQKRWMMSPTSVRNKEPYGAPNFARALNRVPRYVACIQTCVVWWMGIRFQYPVIWLLAEHYTPTYNVPNDWWKEVLLSEGFKVPGIEMAGEYDLARLHEARILSNPDLRRRRFARGRAEG